MTRFWWCIAILGFLPGIAFALSMGQQQVLFSAAPSITGLSLSNSTYTSSTAGTVVGNVVLQGTNNSNTTFTLSGPDAARFQLSSPCTGASCSLQASGTEPDGFHDGIFHVLITPTLSGARGSGVVYPFEVAETVTCNSTITTGFTQATIATAIGLASGTSQYNICLQGSGTIASTVTINKAQVRITGISANNIAAVGTAWYSAIPAITVSTGVTAFINTSNTVTVDHLKVIGPVDDPGVETDNCPASSTAGESQFLISSGNPSGTHMTYSNISGFHCGIVIGDSNTTIEWNLVNDYEYVAIMCVSCATGTMNNNIVTNGRASSHEVNEYPIEGSGSGTPNSAVTAKKNTVINNPIWLCYDAHGGTDINFNNNYCLAPNTSAGIGSLQIGTGTGVPNSVRPRINSNITDIGNGTQAGSIGIAEFAATGGTMTCTGGDGLGCQANSNTILGSYATSVCTNSNSCVTGGTVTGTQTTTGNTTGSAATMAAPVLTTDQPSNGFVAGQPNGVIGKISVTMTPAFPSWVGGWPNYGGWPGTFSIGGTDAAQFQICVDGQHICQKSAGTAAGTYKITVTGTLTGLSNSPQTTGTVTLTGT